MERLTRLMRDVLHKSQRTDKSAQHSSEQNRAYDKGAEESEYLLPALREQHIQVAEIITAGARQLIEVVGTGEGRELNVGEHDSRQPAAEDQQREAEDHDDPPDGFKPGYEAPFPHIL